MLVAEPAVEEVGVEGSAGGVVIALSTSVPQGRTALLVRHESDRCTVLAVAQSGD